MRRKSENKGLFGALTISSTMILFGVMLAAGAIVGLVVANGGGKSRMADYRSPPPIRAVHIKPDLTQVKKETSQERAKQVMMTPAMLRQMSHLDERIASLEGQIRSLSKSNLDLAEKVDTRVLDTRLQALEESLNSFTASIDKRMKQTAQQPENLPKLNELTQGERRLLPPPFKTENPTDVAKRDKEMKAAQQARAAEAARIELIRALQAKKAQEAKLAAAKKAAAEKAAAERMAAAKKAAAEKAAQLAAAKKAAQLAAEKKAAAEKAARLAAEKKAQEAKIAAAKKAAAEKAAAEKAARLAAEKKAQEAKIAAAKKAAAEKAARIAAARKEQEARMAEIKKAEEKLQALKLEAAKSNLALNKEANTKYDLSGSPSIKVEAQNTLKGWEPVVTYHAVPKTRLAKVVTKPRYSTKTASREITGSIKKPSSSRKTAPKAKAREKKPFAVHIASATTIYRIKDSWLTLQRDNGILRGLTPHLVSAPSGKTGKVPWKLLAGPVDNEDEAARICTRLNAKGNFCRRTNLTGTPLQF